MQATIIIFCKDDVAGICDTLESIRGMDAEVIVYDVSDSHGLENIIQPYGAILKRGKWEGYGHMRYSGGMLASNEWIFMMHSGEVLEEKIKRSIRDLDGNDKTIFYRIYFRNYFLGKWLHFGVKGKYYHIRIGNKANHHLFCGVVNEDMMENNGMKIKTLKGYIRYTPIKDHYQMMNKADKEAMLSALHYYRAGRKSSVFKLLFSPVMSFINNYFLRLGILEGRAGFICSRLSARYSYLKYKRLKELHYQHYREKQKIAIGFRQ